LKKPNVSLFNWCARVERLVVRARVLQRTLRVRPQRLGAVCVVENGNCMSDGPKNWRNCSGWSNVVSLNFFVFAETI
jgi:hypothetical protein